MTTNFYSRMQATANRLMVKYGRSVTLTYVTTGAYSPATSTATPSSASATVIGVESDYSTREIDGVNILRGDKKLLFPGSVATPPAVGDTVTVGSITYRILNVFEVAPGGTVVMYECQGRA